MFVAAAVATVPYTPAAFALSLPLIHVHCLVEGLNSQRSLRLPVVPLLSAPAPPISQKLPLWSVQETAEFLAPGTFAAAGTPRVPKTDAALTVLLPLIHVHCLVEGLNSHRSFKAPSLPAESKPAPPKSQRLLLLSIQEDEPVRPPGTLAAAAEPSVP